MDTRAFDLKPGDVVSDAWHMPVVVNYDGPAPTFIGPDEMVIPSGVTWDEYKHTRVIGGAAPAPVVGRKSRRTARLTARYFRAAAKREAKP